MKNVKENLELSLCKSAIKGTKLKVVNGKTGIYFRSGRNKKSDAPATMICKIILNKEK